MTQEMINKEKEELMNRIKGKIGFFHMLNVIDLIFVVVISVFFLSNIFLQGGNKLIYSSQFYIFLLLVFLALAISFFMWRYSAKLKSISDAKEYLRQYDKMQRCSYWTVIPFAIVFTVAAFLLWRSAIAIAIVIAWVILIIAIFRSGLYKNRDIERLRELLEQEDNDTRQ